MHHVDQTKELLLRDKLTQKQINFCHTVVSGVRPFKAYFECFREEEGKTLEGKELQLCRRQSSRLIGNGDVKRYIEYLSGRASEAAIVAREEIFEVLTEIMYREDCADRDKIAACRELMAAHKSTIRPEPESDRKGVGSSLIDSLESLILRQ